MRHISIRPAKPADVADIQAVAQQSWSEVYEGIIPSHIQRQALETWYSPSSLVDAIESTGSVFLVAEGPAQVVGFAQLVVTPGAWGALTRIYVVPHSQRQGVGGQLLAETLRRARELGVIDVSVTVEQRNRKGRAFYERAGFREPAEGSADICGFAIPVVTYRHHMSGPAA